MFQVAILTKLCGVYLLKTSNQNSDIKDETETTAATPLPCEGQGSNGKSNAV